LTTEVLVEEIGPHCLGGAILFHYTKEGKAEARSGQELSEKAPRKKMYNDLDGERDAAHIMGDPLEQLQQAEKG